MKRLCIMGFCAIGALVANAALIPLPANGVMRVVIENQTNANLMVKYQLCHGTGALPPICSNLEGLIGAKKNNFDNPIIAKAFPGDVGAPWVMVTQVIDLNNSFTVSYPTYEGACKSGNYNGLITLSNLDIQNKKIICKGGSF